MSRLGTHRFLSTTEFHRCIHIPPDVYTLSTASNTARRLKILRAEDAKKKKAQDSAGYSVVKCHRMLDTGQPGLRTRPISGISIA